MKRHPLRRKSMLEDGSTFCHRHIFHGRYDDPVRALFFVTWKGLAIKELLAVPGAPAAFFRRIRFEMLRVPEAGARPRA